MKYDGQEVEQNQEDHRQRVKRISRVSGIMKWVLTIFMALVFLVGILVLSVLLFPDLLDVSKEVIEFGESDRTYADVPAAQRWGLAFFYDACIGAFLVTIWFMRSVFARFQVSDFFSSETLSSMVWCGIWFVIFGIMDFLEAPVASILTTFDLEEGKRQLVIDFEGGELFFIVFGVMFITLSWVMREAASLHEENQQFI